MFRLFRRVLEIVPRVRLGPVHLGASRAEAREAMRRFGFPLDKSAGGVDCYCGSSLQTESGDGDRIDFIEVRPTRRFVARLYGHDVFATPASELFALAAARDESGPHAYEPSEYLFPRQILALWHADEQHDLRGRGRRPVWGAVGVGNDAYAAVVATLQQQA